jgi:hypothetical protein
MPNRKKYESNDSFEEYNNPFYPSNSDAKVRKGNSNRIYVNEVEPEIGVTLPRPIRNDASNLGAKKKKSNENASGKNYSRRKSPPTVPAYQTDQPSGIQSPQGAYNNNNYSNYTDYNNVEQNYNFRDNTKNDSSFYDQGDFGNLSRQNSTSKLITNFYDEKDDYSTQQKTCIYCCIPSRKSARYKCIAIIALILIIGGIVAFIFYPRYFNI